MSSDTNNQSGKNSFLVPSRNKLILFVCLSVFLWFFPIVSRSVIAVPFMDLSSKFLSIIINIAVAYLISCLIFFFSTDKKKLYLTIIIIILVYLAVPKVALTAAGDMGGSTAINCDCIGLEFSKSQCCYSEVTYCIGICIRNENTTYWPKYGSSDLT